MVLHQSKRVPLHLWIMFYPSLSNEDTEVQSSFCHYVDRQLWSLMIIGESFGPEISTFRKYSKVKIIIITRMFWDHTQASHTHAHMEKTFAFTPPGKKWHKRKKPSGRHSLGSIWPPRVTLNFIQMDDSHLKRVFWKILNDAHALNGCKTQPRAGTKRANSGGTEVKKATGVVIQHSKIKSRGRIQVDSSELS